jgi:predicted lactoylglutathione lyase
MELLSAFVKLLVRDRDASAAFYAALGFERVGVDGTFVHMHFPDGGDVFLVSTPPGVQVDARRGYGVLLCFKTTRELAELARAAAKLGVKYEGPEEKAWNTVELVVVDPDGYRLNFIAPIQG